MYTGLKHLHSFVPYILLILLFATLLSAIVNTMKDSEYTKTHEKISLFTLITSHIQLLIGILLMLPVLL
mgnify:FL=1